MLKYFISTLAVFSCLQGFSQEETDSTKIVGNTSEIRPIDTQPKDTVVYKQAYGLRVGVDLSRPTISFFEPEYTGIELVGDYRISYKLFLAAELGNEKRDRQEDLFNFTTSGSYVKLGIDYNTYANWYGEQNMIYFGGRYAFSTFSQTLNTYRIFDSNRYWNPDGFAEGSSEAKEFSGLNASWLEFIVGVKAELFANIYLGGSIRMGFLISEKEPENFKNLFIPGFNKVTDGARFGIGYNFTISYFIPLYKKANRPKKRKISSAPVNQN